MDLREDLPAAAMLFLHHIDDYSVGGSCVTPSIEAYQNLREFRTPMRVADDWKYREGVHLNPAGKSSESAYECLRRTPPRENTERVLLMDFDIYSKTGELKGREALTPLMVIDRLKENNMPLPYTYFYSGTPGNFHMLWVYKTPKPREKSMGMLRAVYNYWGADINFKNSTMRNPIYYMYHPQPDGEVAHWWPEWTDEPPLLDTASDLLPELPEPDEGPVTETLHYKSSKGIRKMNQSAPVSTGKYKHQMTMLALESAMSRAEDGDGRWYLLKSWVVRQIWLHGKARTRKEMWDLVNAGNEILAEPMRHHRLKNMVDHWTPNAQEFYIWRQGKASVNDHAVALRKKTVMEYFHIYDMREYLINTPVEEMTPELQELDSRYSGRLRRYGKSVSREYLTWMLGLVDYEEINEETGEVTTVNVQKKVTNLLLNGQHRGYTREEYEEALAEDATSEAILGDVELTHVTEGDTIVTTAGSEVLPTYVTRTSAHESHLSTPTTGHHGAGGAGDPPKEPPKTPNRPRVRSHQFNC